ncbi:Holliday junction resolvase RuvX [Candidatus Lariskella endosymbiont of Epinotia ramella]|uniref:Holliday junction resolvase RuvX n=1 Tax=Candidatus Lariskella endosymbiont of Epinotia ramella TaxID=3066224 RepID=UPI0030D5483B
MTSIYDNFSKVLSMQDSDMIALFHQDSVQRAEFTDLIKYNPNSVILGLDVGQKKIGIAKCNMSINVVLPLMVMKRHFAIEEDLIEINSIISSTSPEKVIGFVLGLPRQMNGTLGQQSEYIISFANALKEFFKMPVALYDERLSTKAADKLLSETQLSRKKRNSIDDKFAAALILDSFLKSLSIF